MFSNQQSNTEEGGPPSNIRATGNSPGHFPVIQTTAQQVIADSNVFSTSNFRKPVFGGPINTTRINDLPSSQSSSVTSSLFSSPMGQPTSSVFGAIKPPAFSIQPKFGTSTPIGFAIESENSNQSISMPGPSGLTTVSGSHSSSSMGLPFLPSGSGTSKQLAFRPSGLTNLHTQTSTGSAFGTTLDNRAMQNPKITSSADDHDGPRLQRSQNLKSMLTDYVKKRVTPQKSHGDVASHSKVSRNPGLFSAIPRTRKISSSFSPEQAAALLTCAVICHDVPAEINNQKGLKEHFSKFGEIIRVVASPIKQTATVVFKTHEMAAKAKAEGAYVHETDSTMSIFFSKKGRKSTEKALQAQSVSRPEDRGMQKHKPVSRFMNPPTFGKFASSKRVVSHVYARTDEEKLAILEKIDKVLRKRVVRQSDITKAKTSKGTCPDMCPEKERYLRKQRQLLSAYEIEGDDVNHAKAVKEYSRSSADQEEPLPHELRPVSVLKMTMHYLLLEMFPKLAPGQVADWYDFLWNRTRAIRKELTIQQIKNEEAVHINEQCARFHIFCAHQFCGENRMVFDPKINNENLEKTMKTVMDLYQDVYFSADRGTQQYSLANSNVAELYGYYILLNINKTADVLNELQGLSPEIRSCPDIGIAVEAFMAVHSNNYVKFFKIVRRATYLQACILHRYYDQVRKRAVMTMAKAFPSLDKKNVLFPIEDFLKVLNFNDMNELDAFCVYLSIGKNGGNLEISRTGFEEQDEAGKVPSAIIQEKVEFSNLPEIIANCPFVLEHHEPYSSFDGEGRYIGEYASLLSSEKLMPDTFQALKPTSIQAEEEVPTTSRALPPRISHIEIKNIAKELFHEVIDEISLQLSTDMWEGAVCGTLSKVIFEEVIKDLSQSISNEMIAEAKEAKRKEEEKQKLLEEEKMRKELLIKEEKRKREQKEKERRKREKEREEMKAKISGEIIDELQRNMEDDMIKSTAETVYKDLKWERELDVMSEREQSEILRQVVSDIACEISTDTFIDLKKEQCQDLFKGFRSWKLARLLQKWKRVMAAKLKFQTLTKTFPNVPLSRSINDQLKTLVPRASAPKRHSFPLDSNTELSLRTPMSIVRGRKRCHTFMDKSIPKMQKLHELSTKPLPFCDMLMASLGKMELESMKPREIFWKIGVKLIDLGCDRNMFSWINKSFVGENETVATYSNENSDFSVNVCCRKLNSHSTSSDVVGCFSLVFVLPLPDSLVDDGYWELARSELELLISTMPAVPPVSLLIVLLGWNADEYTLDEQLGLSLLDFTFSQWNICSLKNREDAIFENYNKLKEGIESLFEELPTVPSLTTVTLREFFETHLSTRYVTPLSKHVSDRRTSDVPPLHPAYQIQFFNFVVDSLAVAVTGDNCSAISWPPKEFLNKSYQSLPMENWNSDDNLSGTENAMLKCQVPAFPITPLPQYESDILETALQYADTVCPDCPSLQSAVKYRVAQQLHKLNDAIDLNAKSVMSEEEDVLSSFDWNMVIDTILSEHLTRMLYRNELGDKLITFPTDALDNIQEHPEFQNLFSEAAFLSLNETRTERSVLGKTGFSEIFDDQFSQLDYSLPENSITDISWMRESDVNDTMEETKHLHDNVRKEHELSLEYTHKLEELLNGDSEILASIGNTQWFL